MTRLAAVKSAKDNTFRVERQELETIEIASTRALGVDSFVPRADMDRRFFDTPYYIVLRSIRSAKMRLR